MVKREMRNMEREIYQGENIHRVQEDKSVNPQMTANKKKVRLTLGKIFRGKVITFPNIESSDEDCLTDKVTGMSL